MRTVQQVVRSLTFFAAFAMLAACGMQSGKGSGDNLTFARPNLAGKSPQEIFDIAKGLPAPAGADSVYQPLIERTARRDNAELVARLLSDYEKLRGDAPGTHVFRLIHHAYLLQFSGQLDSSQTLYQQALDLAKTEKNIPGMARAKAGLGANLYYMGRYGESTDLLLEAMQDFTNLGDSNWVNMVKLEQCGNLFRNFECERMNKLAISTLPWFSRQRDSFFLAAVSNIRGLFYECSQNFDSAIVWHRKALALRTAIGDLRGGGESLNNIAVLLVKKKEFAAAIEQYKEAIELMGRTGDLRNLGILRSNLGRCYQMMGQYDEAIALYRRSAEELEKNGQLDAVYINLERLAGALRAAAKPEEALNQYLKSRILRDSIFNETKRRDINEINLKFETELKEQRIARLEAQKRSNQLWLGLLAVSFALAVTMLFFYIFRLRQREKILAGEQKLLEAREQMQAKDLEITRVELSYNRRKLEETIASLGDRNRLVEELRNNLDSLSSSLGEQSQMQGVQRSLSTLYSMKILTDDNWNDFRVQFEQVYPGLINQARKRFPELADAELRLILLIKMGVRSREIANVLGISPESVAKTRYRLRKRLGLDEQDKLEEFIKAFH